MKKIEFDIIGDVTQNMELHFSELIDEALKNPKTPVLLKINSKGGSVEAGISMYNQLIALPNPVYTLITGECKSIAGIIFLATDFKKRYAFPLTSFLAHPSSVGKIEGVNKARLRKILSDSEEIDKIILNIILTNTKIDSEVLTKIFDSIDEEFVLKSEEFEKNRFCRVISKFSEIPIFRNYEEIDPKKVELVDFIL